jgi:hypothetical protein
MDYRAAAVRLPKMGSVSRGAKVPPSPSKASLGLPTVDTSGAPRDLDASFMFSTQRAGAAASVVSPTRGRPSTLPSRAMQGDVSGEMPSNVISGLLFKLGAPLPGENALGGAARCLQLWYRGPCTALSVVVGDFTDDFVLRTVVVVAVAARWGRDRDPNATADI